MKKTDIKTEQSTKVEQQEQRKKRLSLIRMTYGHLGKLVELSEDLCAIVNSSLDFKVIQIESGKDTGEFKKLIYLGDKIIILRENNDLFNMVSSVYDRDTLDFKTSLKGNLVVEKDIIYEDYTSFDLDLSIKVFDLEFNKLGEIQAGYKATINSTSNDDIYLMEFRADTIRGYCNKLLKLDTKNKKIETIFFKEDFEIYNINENVYVTYNKDNCEDCYTFDINTLKIIGEDKYITDIA